MRVLVHEGNKDNLSKTGTEAGFKNTEIQVEQVGVVMVVGRQGRDRKHQTVQNKNSKIKTGSTYEHTDPSKYQHVTLELHIVFG